MDPENEVKNIRVLPVSHLDIILIIRPSILRRELSRAINTNFLTIPFHTSEDPIEPLPRLIIYKSQWDMDNLSYFSFDFPPRHLHPHHDQQQQQQQQLTTSR